MTQLCRKMFHFNIKRRILWRVSILRWYLNSIWKRFLACWIGKSSVLYRQLSTAATTVSFSSSPLGGSAGLSSTDMASTLRCCCNPDRDSSDLVSLKISLLGDGQIGKTSFLTKYAGREKGLKEFAMTGMNQVDKTLCVKGAHISYSIWEVGGNVSTADDNIPAACKDSVAMLFMFDLTSRCTLNSVIPWFQQARQWNQTAIPVIIGTKFDDFVQLPIDLQWTIASQARAYAKALNATLFFSSATYNINVNKIFKFITAKLFNLPWNLERNLTVGEPIIDF
ncbi:septum-promoting GTP-binding protein 1-like [Olea europaea var. sylvestris]|uniref:septum-promoting GTP-binding protein 1-like n=1 Tax=Olea europaea var. sylvestris TaxID=158386 RepID=UPI000C1CEF8E|nr:septum-promoting GTP-binding protein 1-like [Olea europaea var. sylvestris]